MYWVTLAETLLLTVAVLRIVGNGSKETKRKEIKYESSCYYRKE